MLTFEFDINNNTLIMTRRDITIKSNDTNEIRFRNSTKRFDLKVDDNFFILTEKVKPISVKDFMSFVNKGFVKLEDLPYINRDKLYTINNVFNIYTDYCIKRNMTSLSRDIFISDIPKKYLCIDKGILYIQLK